MKVYQIKKGRHRPFFQPWCLKLTKNIDISKKLKFNKSWWWRFNEPEKDGDWCKLMGFMSGLRIHGESYRFGIRPTIEGLLEVCPYIYQKGKRLDSPMTWKFTFDLNETLDLSIRVIDGTVYYYINQKIIYKIKMIRNRLINFTTDIYIGGGVTNEKDWAAPHKITLIEL